MIEGPFQRAWTPVEALEHVLNPHAAGVSIDVARLAVSEALAKAASEQLRQARHHEVFARMIERCYVEGIPEEDADKLTREAYIERVIALARLAANLAYPPPKDTP